MQALGLVLNNPKDPATDRGLERGGGDPAPRERGDNGMHKISRLIFNIYCTRFHANVIQHFHSSSRITGDSINLVVKMYFDLREFHVFY